MQKFHYIISQEDMYLGPRGKWVSWESEALIFNAKKFAKMGANYYGVEGKYTIHKKENSK
jgi:hypothetical protein